MYINADMSLVCQGLASYHFKRRWWTWDGKCKLFIPDWIQVVIDYTRLYFLHNKSSFYQIHTALQALSNNFSSFTGTAFSIRTYGHSINVRHLGNYPINPDVQSILRYACFSSFVEVQYDHNPSSPLEHQSHFAFLDEKAKLTHCRKTECLDNIDSLEIMRRKR